MKKAQITMFILIGIIIFLAAAATFFIFGKMQGTTIPAEDKETQILLLETNAIKAHIDSCLSLLTDRGVRIMGENGFYLSIPAAKQYDDSTAYWMKKTVNIMPARFSEMENELESYIDSNFDSCLSFDRFTSQGWNISTFDPVIDVEIQEEDISSKAFYTITVKKSSFTKELKDSIYIPNIRFRQMYAKSVDLMNNQLLRADFDITNPLKDYDSGDYSITYTPAGDGKTLVFSLTDQNTKLIDNQDFELRFAANFEINHLTRVYAAGSQYVYSPDRLAVLYFSSGSPAAITASQYEQGSVTKYQTPTGKKNSDYIGYEDITFTTDYPIYKFGPSGLSFANAAYMVIYLNKDQRSIPADYFLLHNGVDGWSPYPGVVDSGTGTITTMIYGFK